MAGLLSVRQEDGMALATAIVTSLAVFAVMGVALELGVHHESTSASARRRDQALAAAEAGANAAMSRLSADAEYTGDDLVSLGSGLAEYSVTVTRLSVDPADPRRYIVSLGYAPSRSAPRAAVRRVEQEVALDTIDGFRHALFAGSGGITGVNNATINGDVYSHDALVLANQVTVSGTITSLSSVTTTANSTIGADIRAGGNVAVDNTSTTILGSVYSGGDVTITGKVNGNVQAAGTITGGTVQGSRAPYSPPDPPQAQALPTFVWDPANYPSTQSWSSPGAFQAHWAGSAAAFSGHHRITCPAPCSTPITLDANWTMTGDVTIVSDGPVVLSRKLANGAGQPVTLTIVSFSSADPAILMSNNLTLPDDIRVVVMAPNGPARFTQRKSFTGAVYASSLSLDQQFTLTFVPIAVPGFSWDLSSSTHFRVENRSYKEVPA